MADPGIRAATRFMGAHDAEPEHAKQVCRVSVALFDTLRGVHGLGEPEKRLLTAAALMHDTGFSVDARGHHKHSRDLILRAGLDGFTRNEQRMIACIARYHRKAHPRPAHRVYRDLGKKRRQVVRQLAALLRLADGLDRSHDGATRRVRAECGPGKRKLRLLVEQRRPSEADLWGAERKQGLFEEVFGLRLEIVPDTE